jgi:large subunit ribosomal protein L4
MKLEVLNTEGNTTGKEITLPEEVFGIEPNDQAIYLSVKLYRAEQRQGTHKAKERNAITGSTRKIKKQKGTGTARFGDIKNPLFRGGGRVFGPEPRDYGFKLNKKVKRLARKSALAYKAIQKSVIIVEDFAMEAPKTGEFLAILNNLKVADKKTLWVLPHSDRNIYLSGRNIPNSKTTTARQMNTYNVMDAQCLILSESSVKLIEENLSQN